MGAVSIRSRTIKPSVDDCYNMRAAPRDNELEAILTEKNAEVCLLVDSPYRILRVSKLKVYNACEKEIVETSLNYDFVIISIEISDVVNKRLTRCAVQ